MNSSCIEKIKKLFALAQSDNANERDAALGKAQRIATENNIDLALLDLSDAGVLKEEEMVEDKVEAGNRFEVHKKFAANIVSQVCRVDLVYWTGRAKQISFIGKKSDVEFAKWLYPFLLDEYVRRWNYERKANGLPAGHRNTFFLGIKRGQEIKIRDEREAAERETILSRAKTSVAEAAQAGVPDNVEAAVATKQAEYAGKYQLATVNEDTRRESFKNKLHPRLGTMRSSRVSIRSHDTYSSGLSHGRSISLNRPLN